MISCWDQATAVRTVQAPVLGLAYLSLLALVLADIAMGMPIWLMGRLAGPG